MDLQTILHIANLSKLNYSDEELQTVAAQMSDIIALMDTVKETDVVYDEEGDNNGVYIRALRKDAAAPSMDTAAILQNAVQADNCFVVPKVVE